MIKKCNFKHKFTPRLHGGRCGDVPIDGDSYNVCGLESKECNGEDNCIIYQIYKLLATK